LFEADTTLSTITTPGLGYRREKLQRYERASYSAIVVHTTGRGVHKKAERWGVDPFIAALRVFTLQVDASGHYLIGQHGQLAQVVPEETPAWHVGQKNHRKYMLARWQKRRTRWWQKGGMDWWRERWPQYVTPFELARGQLWAPSPTTGKPSCNANAIGIEVVPPPDNGAWSSLCWGTLCKLCANISERREIPLSLETVLSHSDAHPFARTARGRPWDPAPQQWSYDRFAVYAGLPQVCGVGE
jgi:hypothetical protein